MSLRLLKFLGLVGVLVTSVGASLPCSCVPVTVEFTYDEITPPSGATSNPTVSISAVGTEEHKIGISYTPEAWLEKQQGQAWQQVQDTAYQAGPWGPVGDCNEERTFTLQFDPVNLDEGENRFRICIHIPPVFEELEYQEFWFYSDELTYTYTP